MSQKYTNPSQPSGIAASWWVAATFVPLGLTSFVAFLYAGVRVKNHVWRNFGFMYLGLLIGAFMMSGSGVGASIVFTMWIVSIIHAFTIRQDYLVQLAAIKEMEQQRSQQMWQESQSHFNAAPYGRALPHNMPPVPRTVELPPYNMPAPEGMSSPQGTVPPPFGSVPPPVGHVPPPLGSMPPPLGNVPPPSGGMPPPQGAVPPPFGGMPSSMDNEPPSSGTMPPPLKRPLLEGDIMDINTASEAQIASLPGIGTILAKRVMMKREELGGFKSLEHFSDVMGLKKYTLDRIAPLVVFSHKSNDPINSPTSGRIIDY
ncbi:helix-hairpin-helix domain-containing protein [Paenibacillus woosongensis]|uniref:Helix-hairpin-helix domain-containing protein n=1 Tax=Paenibacillus woosongensis TaxID=307580 RepID=A0AA95I9H0_9BACL|nr:helix-hairpin-helix domain-containing protein [Paenibacillus woosongensis]WHX48977.1 helix-hairpin-helix domain-containing protein [Paenibacillus woosongensis]